MTDDDTTELCGHPTADDTPCEHFASRSDGRCHLHTEIEEDRVREGRPSTFEDHREDCLEAAERGLTYEGIARVAGVGLSTLNDWRDEHPEFDEELERRRAIGEQKLVERVAQKRPEFILERSYDYIKTEKREIEGEHEHTGEGGGPIEVTVRRERYDPDE